MFGYPPLVLAYDAYIKFVLGDETISEKIWQSPKLKVAVLIYLTLWFGLLFAHFAFMFLPG